MNITSIIIPYRTLLKILFIFSLFLFIPLFEPSRTVTVFQETSSSFVMSIHTPRVQVSADKATTEIFMDVYYIDTATGEQHQITPDELFFFGARDEVVETTKPGTYLFEFLVDEVVQITIDPIDMYPITLAIFFLIATFNIVVLTRDYVIYMEN